MSFSSAASSSSSSARSEVLLTESILREKLRDNGRRSAALAAQLSVCLAKRGVAESNDTVRSEAVEWAKQAIALAPGRPAGYGALSVASTNHQERMDALHKTQQLWNPLCLMKRSAFCGSLVRLLVEPRDEESKRLKQTKTTNNSSMGSANPQHPSRRSLNPQEETLLARIEKEIQQTLGENNRHADTEYIGALSYRLGMMFRKMEPAHRYRPLSRTYLERACHLLPTKTETQTLAQFWLATISTTTHGQQQQEHDRCPPEYIVSLYSTFASRFDSLLVDKLQYASPQLLRNMVDRVVGLATRGGGDGAEPAAVISEEGKPWAARAVDLGCGTGLSGLAFRGCTRHLSGVDLSPAMVEKAHEKGCYDKLTVADVMDFLDMADPDDYQLVVSCDVLVYLGNLQAVFEGVYRCLVKGGIFAFTTERLEEEEEEDNRPYLLRACGRFAHKQTYLEKLAKKVSFEVTALQTSVLRKNGGKDVMGILAVLKKNL